MPWPPSKSRWSSLDFHAGGAVNAERVFIRGWRSSDSGELNDQLLVAEPRHGRGVTGQTGGDEIRIVGSFVEGHHDRSGRDLYLAGQVQQVAKDGLGLGMNVFSTYVSG